MRLWINGEQGEHAELADGASIADLIASLGLGKRRLAVERNGAVVEREAWPATWLQTDDRIEVVHFVGGG